MNPLASCSPDENFSGFPAHPSIPFNPEPVYCCASATLQAATVDAAASSRAHCRTRASQVHLLAAISAIAETNQELVASKHQAQAPLLHQVKCQPENRLGSRVHPQEPQLQWRSFDRANLGTPGHLLRR
uniref:Uncharacterized protein n=1 Tax=Triticum urartu TaxID=4572 RepID=A0A8R7QQY4_TRIUA